MATQKSGKLHKLNDFQELPINGNVLNITEFKEQIVLRFVGSWTRICCKVFFLTEDLANVPKMRSAKLA